MPRVELAVYDLSNGLASQMSQAILGQRIDGIWHTGILVYGYEYFFGGGVQKLPIGQFTTGNGLRPVQTLYLGETTIPQHVFEQHLNTIRSRYTQETYDLINHNCNNFSDEISKYLLGGTGIPTHIVDLPRIVFSTPGGAMLRPLIEGMQNNIRSQTGAPLDPFGGNAAAAAPPMNVFHEQSLSQTITQSLQNPDLISSSSQSRDLDVSTLPPLPSSLAEERPLVSSERDCKPIQAMTNKILSYQDPVTSQAALTDSQRALVEETVRQLVSSTPLQDLQFPNETFVLLGSLLNQFPPLEMACLFLMRLMILIPNQIDSPSVSPILELLIQRISLTVQKATSASLREFTTSQLVLALCVLANCISHHAGCLLLFSSHSSGETTLSLCIDAAMWGMCHERSDIRQICGALAYNTSLASTKWEQESTAGVQLSWRCLHVESAYHPQREGGSETEGAGEGAAVKSGGDSDVNDDEIHPHVVQLLCGSLDNIDGENDPVALRRRILTAYRVSRSGGENVKNLAVDLGYDSVICEIRKRELAKEPSAGAAVLKSDEDRHLIAHLENYFKS